MKQINLYQAAFRPPSIALPARSIALSGAVLLAGLLALYVWDDWQLRQLREQVAKLSQHADALTRQVGASAPGVRQADPALAVIPRGGGRLGVLVWCGPPRGRPADAEAIAWKAAAARYGVAVVLPGSTAADAWSRDDIPGVTRALAALNARRPIDPARVGIAGSGAGGVFAWLVAARLGAVAGGVALVAATLPRRVTVEPAQPGRSWWVLLGPGSDAEMQQRAAADRARLERAGHTATILAADPVEPAAADTLPTPEDATPDAAQQAAAGVAREPPRSPPADLLCRWVALLGLL
jgi:dienelactone hydrolase